MTAPTPGGEMLTVLAAACATAGLDSNDAELLRLSENAVYRLPGGVVVRISRPGQLSAAKREVEVARWLEVSGVPAVQAISDITHPVEAGEHAVTFGKSCRRIVTAHQRRLPRRSGSCTLWLRRRNSCSGRWRRSFDWKSASRRRRSCPAAIAAGCSITWRS